VIGHKEKNRQREKRNDAEGVNVQRIGQFEAFFFNIVNVFQNFVALYYSYIILWAFIVTELAL